MSSKILATSFVQLKFHRRSLRLKQWMWIGGLALGGMVSEVGWAGTCTPLTPPFYLCSDNGLDYNSQAACLAACGGNDATGNNTSPGLTPLPPTMPLTVCTKGDGVGTVEAKASNNFDGPFTLLGNYENKDPDCATTTVDTADWVSCEAKPQGGSKFLGWTNSDQGLQRTEFAIKSINCSANFGKTHYLLKVTKTGNGSVTSDPVGITCDSNCTQSFKRETKVTLSAKPDSGWQFAGWGENCESSQTNPQAMLYMGRDVSCTATFTEISKKPQEITHFSLPTEIDFNGTATNPLPLTATGGDSGNPVIFASTTSDVCEVNQSNQLVFKTTGTCTVTADQAGNNDYDPATTVTVTVLVSPTIVIPPNPPVQLGKKDQVIINFTPIGYAFVVGHSAVLNASGGSSGNPVIYASLTPEICTVENNTVTFHQVGICKVTADQTGNDLFNPASQVVMEIQVNPLTDSPQPTPSHWSLVTTSVVGRHLELTSTGGTTDDSVTFSTTSPDICTVFGNRVQFNAAGICTVTATQAGSSISTVAATIIVEVTPEPATTTTDSPTTVPPPPTVADTTASPVPACPEIKEENGILIVSVSCDAKETVFDKPVRILPGASISNVTFNNTVDNQGFLSNIKLGEKAEVKGGTLSGFVDNQGNVCDVEFVGGSFVGGTLCGKIENNSKVGACLKEVTALPGTKITGCVEKKDQAITFDPAKTETSDTATSTDTSGATTPPASSKKDQTITLDATIPTTNKLGATQSLYATASSGLVVTFTSDTPAICTMSRPNLVEFVTAGTCTITASQAGNEHYNAAQPVSLSLNVEKDNQAIIFSGPTAGKVGEQATLSATGSESGNSITFASLTTGVCTVQRDQITFVAVGTCTVVATQANSTAQGRADIAVTTDLPAIPRTTKLEIVSVTSADGVTENYATNPGIKAKMTAGAAGGRVTVWALKDSPERSGLTKDKAAGGKLALKIVTVADRTVYKTLPAVDMLNGEAPVMLPSDHTTAGKYYLEAELTLTVNGDTDPDDLLALPKVVNNVDMFTADKLTIQPAAKPAKLKLSSTKRVISDDANPPQGTPFNPGAANNAATQITVEALDEYGNVIALPSGSATKVTVVDTASVLNASTLNLNFASQKTPTDYIGDNYGDVLKLGEASLIATIEGNPSIAASDPLKIKVVAKNLVAAPYVGSPVPGDTAYGDIAGVPAGDMPYPSAHRYYPNTRDIVKKDMQAGVSLKAFSVGVDGGQLNGIPNGLFEFYSNSKDNAILPNLVGGDDDFVSRNSTVTLVIRTPAGEEVQAVLANPVSAVNSSGTQVVQETVQADGTRGQGARAEVLFTKAVTKKEGDYFIIGDSNGQYGETLVYLPGDIKPSAASKAKILNAHGYEPVRVGKNGRPVLDENGLPIISLVPEIDPAIGESQVLIPTASIQEIDSYGNAVNSGTVTPVTDQGTVELVSLDETGTPISGSTRTVRADANHVASTRETGNGENSAYVISYDKNFVGTDKILLKFANPDIKPRTIEVKIPQEPQLSAIQVRSPQTTLFTHSKATITVSSLDERGVLIDALASTTVSFNGTILNTASIVRAEEDSRDEAGHLTTPPLQSGSIVRPDGGNQQVLILNTGDQEGELTLTFNNPGLPEGTPPPTISFNVIGGKSAAQETCENQGGIFARNQCFSVMNSEHRPTGLVAGLGAASNADNGWYGDDLIKENAAFFGGIMITNTHGIGERNTNQFESTATILPGGEIHLAGIIKVEEEDKGQPADLVVGVLHTYPEGLTWYMLAECSEDDLASIPTCSAFGWKAKTWPQDATGSPLLSQLEPLKSVTLGGTPNDGKEAYVTVDIFKGNFTFDMDSAIRIYFGYKMTEGDQVGKIVYSEKPIEVKIEPIATVQ